MSSLYTIYSMVQPHVHSVPESVSMLAGVLELVLVHAIHNILQLYRNHVFSCNVSVQDEDFTIVGTASNVIDLRILESLHIFRTRPVLNDMQSSYPLTIVGRYFFFIYYYLYGYFISTVDVFHFLDILVMIVMIVFELIKLLV